MSEQDYVAARRQLQTSIHYFKAMKQRVISEYMQEHYPDIEFTVQFADDSLDLEVLTPHPANLEQSQKIGQELYDYIAELNKQAEQEEGK